MGSSEARGVLARTVARQRRDVLAGAVLGAGHQLGEVLVPVLIGVLIDRAVDGGDTRALVIWLAVLALVYVGLSASFRYGARAGERAAEQSAHLLRIGVVRRVLDPRGGAEAGRLPGELTSIATEDAKRVGAVTMALSTGIAACAGIVVSAVVLLAVSVPLGLTVLLGTPALYFHSLFRPINTALVLLDDAQSASAGLARLVGVVDEPAPRVPPALPAPAVPREAAPRSAPVVTLTGVGHAYLPGRPVLHDLDPLPRFPGRS